MKLRPCDAIFGLCLPYRKGLRPAVEAYFCGEGIGLFPHCGDRCTAWVELAFIHGATT